MAAQNPVSASASASAAPKTTPTLKRPSPAESLQTEDTENLLDIIDKLRSLGVSEHVALPQIIVCGDQSSGKSSVLEAVSNVKFPTKDNLCTRFATEVILRRDSKVSLQVTIQAGKNRTTAERRKFSEFSAPATSLDQLPELIKQAQQFMGITTDSQGANFSGDVLQVQVSGPRQPHLTLVDLPGLFHAHDVKQSAEDSELVLNLVKGYMENKRSIILAVISAKNDLANQIVTKHAREIDPEGSRTLGIITKPDTLHVGSESEKAYIQLANNANIKFKLGWHVVRNKDFNDKGKDRDELEKAFFSEGLWKSLPQSHVGVDYLRIRLSNLLQNHIRQELSSLMCEIRDGIDKTQKELQLLGHARPTFEKQQIYLVQVAEKFTNLVQSAINGNYDDEIFRDTDEAYDRRIRATVQNALTDFENELRENGATHVIIEENEADDYKTFNLDDINSPVVLRKTYLEYVRRELRKSKGRELPGLLNPLIIGQLFKMQSKPWHKLIDHFCDGFFFTIVSAVKDFLTAIADQQVCDGLYHVVLGHKLKLLQQDLQNKIVEVFKPLEIGHPVTYNNSFAEKVAQAREARRESKFKQDYDKVVNEAIAHHRPLHHASLYAEMSRRQVETDPEMHSCNEACFYMETYYEIARTSIVDEVAKMAIEQRVLEPLRTILNSQTILSLSHDEVQQIAGESEEIVDKRAQLQRTLDILNNSLLSLERVAIPMRRIDGLSYQDPFKKAFSTQQSSQDYVMSFKPASKKIKM